MAESAIDNCIASSSDVVKFWDLQTFTDLSTVNPFLHHQRTELSSLSWSANGQFIACTDVNGREISIITHGSRDKPVLYSHKEDVGYTCASFLSSSRYLVAGTKQSMLHLWDLKNKNVVRTFRGHSSSVNSLSVHSKDNYVASAGSNGTLLLHRKDSSQPLATLADGTGQAINRVRFSPIEKSLFATTTVTGALSLWSAESLRLLVEFTEAHTAAATDACFSPFNNMLLASCGLDGRIVFYDVISRKVVSDTPLPGPISSVLMIRDGKTIIVGASDGMIYACDMRSSGTPYASVKAHNGPVTCLCMPSKVHRSHTSVKRVSSVPVSSGSSTVTPMVLPSSLTSSVIPEYSTVTPPSSINRPQLATDLFSPLPGALTQPPRVAPTNSSTLKGRTIDESPLLTTSWNTGVTTESLTVSTTSAGLFTATAPSLQNASSSSSLHSSTTDRDDVSSMDLHPSNEQITTTTTTTTTTTNINTTTVSHHATGVQSPVEDSTDGAIVQPSGNFHVQFLENIVQDAMEELKYSLHRDMRYLYADFLRQLSIQGHQQQMQLNRIESMFTNEINSLREENRQLQQENARLKTLY